MLSSPSIGRIAYSRTGEAVTLIVGVICRDGVVIGADSIATASTAVEHQISNKITIEEDDVLIACSGTAGLSQLIKEELRGKWYEIKQLNHLKDVRNAITKAMHLQIEPVSQRAKSAGKPFGGCDTLVALPIDYTPTLLHFTQLADSFEITSELPFESIGSGKRHADPFLAFVKRILWGDSAPNSTRIAIFGVLWTLQHVSRVSAGLGVGGPHWIAVLERKNGAWKAERLGEAELSEHRQAIIEAEDALRAFGEGRPKNQLFPPN